jgi:hypothetical protein
MADVAAPTTTGTPAAAPGAVDKGTGAAATTITAATTAEAPKPAAGSAAFLASLDSARAKRAAQLDLRTQNEQLQAQLKQTESFRSLAGQIEQARAKGDIKELHRLLNIPDEASRTWAATHGAAFKPEDKQTLLEKQLQAAHDRIAAIEAETRKAQETIGTREEEQAAKKYIDDELHSDAAKDKYPLTALLGQGSLVVQAMKDAAKKTGMIPDEKQIRDGIEGVFVGMVEKLTAHPRGIAALEAALAKAKGSQPAPAAKTTETKPPVKAAPEAPGLTETQSVGPRHVKVGVSKNKLEDVMAQIKAGTYKPAA